MDVFLRFLALYSLYLMFCQPGGRVVDALNVIYEKTHKIRKKVVIIENVGKRVDNNLENV